MKITVNSKALLDKLIITGSVIGKSNIPILDNFLFVVEGETLHITSSDMETTITTTLDVQGEGTCNIAVPAKMLIDILKSFPNQPLTLKTKGDEPLLTITSDTGEYAMPYFDGKEFPKQPELSDTATSERIEADVLQEAISLTLFATSTDDLRPIMTGVLFQLSLTGINFVATDAYKLVKYSRKDFSREQPIDFVVPRRSLAALKNALGTTTGDIAIQTDASNARFISGDYTISCRLVDDKYPNYEAVIPKDNPNVLEIDRSQFLRAVKCVSHFSNRTTHQVKLKLSAYEVVLTAEDVDYSNKGEERLQCNYTGEEMMIGFNSRFLTEMLSNLDCDTVTLEMSLPNRAGIIKPVDSMSEGEDVMMLVMPVMLKD